MPPEARAWLHVSLPHLTGALPEGRAMSFISLLHPVQPHAGQGSKNNLQTRMPVIGPRPNNRFHTGIGGMCGWKAGGEAVGQFSLTRLVRDAESGLGYDCRGIS